MKRVLNISAIIIILLLPCKAVSLAQLGFEFEGTHNDLNGNTMPITTSSEKAKELYFKALDLVDDFRNEKTNAMLSEAIKLDPDFALAHLLLSVIQKLYGDSNIADAQLKIAENLSGKVSEGEQYFIQMTSAWISKQPFKDYAEKLNNKYPNDKYLQLLIGYTFDLNGNPKEAIIHYERAVQVDPNFIPVLQPLGYAYMAAGNTTETDKYLKRYMELLPDNADPYNAYAGMLSYLSKYDEAIPYYQKALKINSAYLPSITGMGSTYIQKGQYDDAIMCYENEFEHAANQKEKYAALQFKAITNVYKGDVSSVVKAYDQWKELAVNSQDYKQAGDVESGKAYALIHFGQPDDALKSFESAAEFIKRSGRTEKETRDLLEWNKVDRSIALALKGELAKAKTQLAEVSALPADQRFEDYERKYNEAMGMVAFQENKFDDAIKYLSADQICPLNWYYVSEAYKHKGDMDNAQKWIDKISQVHDIRLDTGLAKLKSQRTIQGYNSNPIIEHGNYPVKHAPLPEASK